MNKTSLIIFFFSLNLLPFVVSAGMYKCIDTNGKTTFQAKPCSPDTKETKIKYKQKRASSDAGCQTKCDSKYLICLGDQDNSWNRNRGLALCKEAKKACQIACDDPEEGKHLKKMADLNRYNYENTKTYKKHLKDINKKYDKQMKKYKKSNCSYYKQKLDRARMNWDKKRKKYTQQERRYYKQRIEDAREEVNRECA